MASKSSQLSVLAQDVDELTREMTKLINTSNRRGKELLELQQSNNEIVEAIRDVRAATTKLRGDVASTAKVARANGELSQQLSQRLDPAALEQQLTQSLTQSLTQRLRADTTAIATRQSEVLQTLSQQLTQSLTQQLTQSLRQEMTQFVQEQLDARESKVSEQAAAAAAERDARDTGIREQLTSLEQQLEATRNASVNREHLSLLREQFEEIRGKYEGIDSRLASRVRSVNDASDVESRVLREGEASLHYLRLGETHLLLSPGFTFDREELCFALDGIPLPPARASRGWYQTVHVDAIRRRRATIPSYR